MVAEDTTSSGNLFQSSTILWLKKCFLISNREFFLYSYGYILWHNRALGSIAR